MTTAHRPTFDPARGKEAQRGPAYHQRLLPAHTQLKTRQPGQGGTAETQNRDLRAQLLQAEAAHFTKTGRVTLNGGGLATGTEVGGQFQFGELPLEVEEGNEDPSAKRLRVLEATRDIDADSEGFASGSSEGESDDDDETAELMRELEKIKKERAEQREREERAKAAEELEKRERDIALGNPLLNPTRDFNVRRRWDDDVVFKNQARGTEDKRKKEFVNDLLRSDFHKRFMNKYVR